MIATKHSMKSTLVVNAVMFILVSSVVAGCGRRNGETGLADLVEKIEPAVIMIEVATPRATGFGSGFVVKADGVAVTNYHVIDGATKAVAKFSNGKKTEIEGVLFFDADRDIAVIKLADTTGAPVMTLAKLLPRKGDVAITFGAPKGLSFSVSEGIVSGVRNDDEVREPVWPKGVLIQSTAPISNGNSGGPLVNRRGEVIGMNTFFVSGQNLNFSISSLEVISALGKSEKASIIPLPVESSAGSSKEDKPLLSESQQRLIKMFASKRSEREKEIQQYRKDIDALRRLIKEHTIRADDDAERKACVSLRTIISNLNELLERPLDFPSIDPSNLKSNSIGALRVPVVEVVQVLSKSDGVCLARIGRVLLKLRGLDLTNVADSSRLKIGENLIFEVVGTTTYETVSGSTNTVFELACITDIEPYVKPFAGEVEPGLGLLKLSDAERQQRNSAIEERQREQQMARVAREKQEEEARIQRKLQAQEADRMNEAAQIEKKAAKERSELKEKEKKALAKLELAKNFLKKDDKKAAKKWLQQVVEEFPKTQAATEASELLEKIQ